MALRALLCCCAVWVCLLRLRFIPSHKTTTWLAGEAMLTCRPWTRPHTGLSAGWDADDLGDFDEVLTASPDSAGSGGSDSEASIG